jgi:hypothetical protein
LLIFLLFLLLVVVASNKVEKYHMWLFKYLDLDLLRSCSVS